MRVSYIVPVLALFGGASTISVTLVQAQETSESSTAIESRWVTAGERIGLLRIWQSDAAPVLGTSASGTKRRVPGSEVRGELRRRAQEWAASLAAAPGAGIQLDAAGELFISAGDITSAQAVFGKRLATPGLSLADSAYTLELAVGLFSRGGRASGDTARLVIAKQYLKQLDALPTSISVAKFKGHMSLAYTHYFRGDGAAAVAEALDALNVVKEVGFAERYDMMVAGDGRAVPHALTMLGEIWSVDTTHRSILDSVGKHMLSLAKASPEQLANDTKRKTYAWASGRWTEDVQNAMAMNGLVGKPAPPLIGTHWYNTETPPISSDAAPNARALPAGDGVIRVVELGGLGCAACLSALPVMERVRDRFQDQPVSVWYLSQSDQRWGATDCKPDECAEHIYKYYVKHHGTTLQLGVWSPPIDDSTREVGAVLARENPNFLGYHIDGIPVFVVVDGQGRVRRMIRGGGPTLERTLTQVVTYLLAENGRTTEKPLEKTPSAVATRLEDRQ